MNSSKRCPRCGAENDGFFEYCYKCGAPLNVSAYGQPFTAAPNSGYYEPATVAGHPTEEVKAFVGQSPHSRVLARKVIDTQISGSATHWCWPVFLFSLLGPMFTAIWFFYRKMYKVGWLVALSGFLLTGADVLLHLEYQVSLAKELLELIYSSHSITELMEKVVQSESTLPTQNSIGALLSSIIDLLSMAFGVIMAMFAVGIYKGHIGKKLSSNPAIKSNYFTLAAAGGTSVALGVLAGLVFWMIQNVLSNISIFIALATI